MDSSHLSQKGFRLTRQRRELLQALQESPTLLTAEELHRLVQAQEPAVSLSTIYRNLDLLVAEGLVCKVDLGDGQARYGARRHPGHHHHVVCLGCGRAEDLECPLPALAGDLARRGFRITGHRLLLYGYCAACDNNRE